jgi:hypothetical protein
MFEFNITFTRSPSATGSVKTILDGSYQRNPRAPRSQRGKKNYKQKTFKFRENIWNNYVKSIFSKQRKRRN